MSSILITGATGTVGREVVRSLTEKEVPFRVATHHVEALNAQAVYLDFLQPETFLPALAGVEKIFLVRPPQVSDAKKYFLPFLQAAKQQGVQQIVFLSIMGAEKLRFAPHTRIEQYIRQTDIPYTFLRSSFFTQNLITQHIDELRQDHTIYLPAGKGRTSLIDTRDIGEAAALSLLDARHLNKAYTLTGSQSLTYFEVAQTLTDELGREITYANPSLFQFRKRMLAKGVPGDYVSIMLGVYFIAIVGIPKAVKPDLEQLLGRPAKTVREFAHDYREQF